MTLKCNEALSILSVPTVANGSNLDRSKVVLYHYATASDLDPSIILKIILYNT
jgi:hypothetical protein